MADNSQLLLLAQEYANSKGIQLVGKDMLGYGSDGSVWHSSRRTAVKSLYHQKNFDNELECYLRLKAADVRHIGMFEGGGRIKLARMLNEDVHPPRGIACVTYSGECAVLAPTARTTGRRRIIPAFRRDSSFVLSTAHLNAICPAPGRKGSGSSARRWTQSTEEDFRRREGRARHGCQQRSSPDGRHVQERQS